jgi:micrococcal nuclease
MKQRTGLALGAATFAAIVITGALVLPAFSDPTPVAPAESANAAEGLRGRAQHISASHADAQQIRVIDGDTIEDVTADITYRIENIDTPETGSRARCVAERNLGNRATSAARALITNASDLEIRATGRIDRYQRVIAFVLVDGRDLGETLIAEGLARPWRGRREPWCDAGGNLIP